MIIAISGKISSGKDTVGKIIQYLVDISRCLKENPNWQEEHDSIPYTEKDFNDYLYAGYDEENCSEWKIRKFADKLKDTVCLWTGCTREQLEDADFKDKILDENWWYYKISKGFINDFDLVPYLNNTLSDVDKAICDSRYLIKPTYRLLLQQIGTDCARNIIHPNVWVNALFSEYIKTFVNNDFNKSDGTSSELEYPNWIITDCRFPNELEAIKKRDGISIRVNRKPFKWIDDAAFHFKKTGERLQKIGEHSSEIALDQATFDYVIDNNSSIEDLIMKVKDILITEKII